MNDLSLTVNKQINAPIAQVFDAWLKPELLSRFMLPAEGMPEPKVEIDSAVGGKFSIIMVAGDNEMPHSGEYLEIDRPNKLVFSWVSAFSAPGSTVSIEFKALSSDVTDVELTHVIFADETSRDNHQNGWGRILQELSGLMVAA